MIYTTDFTWYFGGQGLRLLCSLDLSGSLDQRQEEGVDLRMIGAVSWWGLPCRGCAAADQQTAHQSGQSTAAQQVNGWRAQAKFPPISPKGVLFSRRPNRGAPVHFIRSGTHSLGTTPDLCKSGARITKTRMFSIL